MTFPSGNQVTTTELAAGTGNPATARAQLYLLATWFNELVASKNLANGVAVLDGGAQLLSSQFPDTFSPTGILTLAPSAEVVKIENVLRLEVMPKANVLALANSTVGDMALAADDLTGANAKLCMYNGTVWKIIATLSTATTLS